MNLEQMVSCLEDLYTFTFHDLKEEIGRELASNLTEQSCLLKQGKKEIATTESEAKTTEAITTEIKSAEATTRETKTAGSTITTATTTGLPKK